MGNDKKVIDINYDERKKERTYGQKFLKFAWLPIPLLITAIIIARVVGLEASYRSDSLMLILSLCFSTLVSLGTIFLIGRSFLMSGKPGQLLLACGVTFWCLAATVGDAVSRGDANINVTIFNATILVSGLCHLAGAILSYNPRRIMHLRALFLGAGLVLVAIVLSLIAMAALAEMLPVFFIPGVGGTYVRYMVLTSAIAAILLSSWVLLVGQREKRPPFVSWYALALILLAVGLFGIMVQLSLGSVVNWLGRAGQWLGGIYLLVASVAAFKESEPVFSAKQFDRIRYRYVVAFAIILAATAVRLAFLSSLGNRFAFVTFFPAVTLAALYGGFRAGLLASILSCLAYNYFWMEPAGQFTPGDPMDWVGMLFFLASCVMISLAIEAMHNARARLVFHQDHLEELVLQRTDELEKEIADHKRAKEALLQSRQWWEITLASIGDAVIASDVSHNVVFINSVAQELTGWTLKDAMNKPVTEVFNIINEETRLEVESPIARVLREGIVVGLANHTILLSKDGKEIPIDDSGAPIKDSNGITVGVVLVFRDITSRRRAEEQSRRDRYLQQLLLDHFPGVVLLLKTSTREVIASNQAGIKVGATCGSKCYETWGQNENPCPWCLAEDLWNTGKEQHVVLDTGERVMEAYWAPVTDDLYIHYALDVTEHIRAEQRLKEKERTIQQALNISDSFTFDWDIVTDQVIRSESCKKIFGIDAEEMCTATSALFAEHVHSEDRERLGQMLHGLTPDSDTYTIAFRFSRTDGTEVILEETAQGYFDKEGRLARVVGVSTDATARKQAEEIHNRAFAELEQRVQERTIELEDANKKLKFELEERERLEEQLRQSQKMEAIGTLAGGIAHDFNNILGAILGFTEMAIDDIEDNPLMRMNLERVMKSAMRARDLVKQILAFSRKSTLERKPLSLTPIITETVQLLRASIATTIDMRISNTSSSDVILAAPQEVQQILMNLTTNASLAMEETGGVIEIGLADVSIKKNSALIGPDMAEGDYLQLTVRDTGVGMNSQIIQRIFDPFFTTRGVGKGTGMGLSVTYGIVRSMGGAIRVESEPGFGSTFTVYFPKVGTEAEIEVLENREKPLSGSERILFVDDEEMLVAWTTAILARLGYKVTGLTSSKEALKVFSDNPNDFDLVITDQAMPELAGSLLIREILRIRADIPVILCTGHSKIMTPEKAKESGVTLFVMKPLVREELAKAIRRALSSDRV